MKSVVRIGLIVLALAESRMARAAPDWTSACAVVGHFAGLVAAERDQHEPVEAATGTARRILDEPSMITDAVGDEIAHQVYDTPHRSPRQEDDILRTECLTPISKPGRGPSQHAEVAVLAPIELNVGANQVADFTPDGRDATVTLSWQDDEGGHGHDVFAVAVAGAGNVIMPSGGDTVRDDPDHDRDMRSSIRLARGRVDGADVTLLLSATRAPGPGPTPTLYRVFALRQHDATYRFVPVVSEQLTGGFCNADMALSVAAGLPLRRSYRGASTANGCPQSSQIARQEQ